MKLKTATIEALPSFTFKPSRPDLKSTGLSFTFRRENNDGYHEASLQITTPKGKVVADLFFTLSPRTGEPVVYSSAGGETEEHQFFIRPLQSEQSEFCRKCT